MNLTREAALPSGLYYFRVVVRFLLNEHIEEKTESGEVLEPWQGFYRSYGVTAPSFAEAARLLEDALWAHHPAGGPDDPKCDLDMFQLDLLDPRTVELENELWRTTPGIHYISGRVFYGGDESPPDNDLEGVEAIRREIRDGDESEE